MRGILIDCYNAIGITKTKGQHCGIAIPHRLYSDASGNRAVCTVSGNRFLAFIHCSGSIGPEVNLFALYLYGRSEKFRCHLNNENFVFVRVCRELNGVLSFGAAFLQASFNADQTNLGQ